MPDLDHLYRQATALLAAAGIDDARREARLLLSHALGLQGQQLLTDGSRPVAAGDASAALALIGRRAQREPVSRIVGRRGFWTLDLELNEATLDPRPDSETLIEALLEAEPDRRRPLRILDLGTGSGCLLLAALSEYPAARGVGIDQAAAAVQMARHNAARHRLEDRCTMVEADWTVAGWAQACGEVPFDVILSNPPYIADSERDSLAPEVRNHDPARALFAGADGLDDYRRLAPQLPALLADGGLVLLETGQGQHSQVEALLQDAGFSCCWNRADLGGITRCVAGRRKKGAEPKKTLGTSPVGA